jgi:hypothetical protein
LFRLTSTVAINNSTAYNKPSDWNFNSAQYSANSFYEGMVDLSSLNLPNLCFSSFILETRSSAELTAMLDDYVGGEFSGTPELIVESEDAPCETETELIVSTSDGSEVKWYLSEDTSGEPYYVGNVLNRRTLQYRSGILYCCRKWNRLHQ